MRRFALSLLTLTVVLAMCVLPAVAQHSVVLTWPASATVQGDACSPGDTCSGGVHGPIGYKVYRVSWYGGSWNLLTVSPVAVNCASPTCTWTDTDAALVVGSAWSYAVSAIDTTNGGFSQPFLPGSEALDVVIPSSTPLVPPSGLVAIPH
jgi:hypothetical protein